MDKLFELIDNVHANTPAARNLCLKNASEEYSKGNAINSIYFQVQALSIGARAKYCYYLFQDDKPIEEKFSLSLTNKVEIKHNALTQYVLKHSNCGKIAPPPPPRSFEQRLEEFHKNCNQLPEEWTVIQICKDFNSKTTFSFESEIFSSMNSVYLSVLRHPRSKTFPDPICIKLDFKEGSVNIFEKLYNFSNEFRDLSAEGNIGKDDKNVRYKFWKSIEDLNKKLMVMIIQLRDFIGPWKCLFTGNVKGDDKISQDEIFTKVDDFSKKYVLTAEQTVLLSMLAREAKLNEIDINMACDYLLKESYSKELEEKIKEFLLDMQSNHFKEDYLPCILIVDEAIDYFCWEMINPTQEICRITSFFMLLELFNKYKDEIKDGYIRRKIQSGNCLINPENNLPKMEQRMHTLISYWFEDWNCVVGSIPSTEEYRELLTSSDIFLYAGHGCGLQFIKYSDIINLNMNSVVFLLGCDSTRYRSEGLHSEMVAAHIYYHAALCPVVIGCLLTAFDFQLDDLSANVLCNWLPLENKTHWNHIDKTAWKKEQKIKVLETNTNNIITYEPRLAKIISNLRANVSGNTHDKVLLIYRGLPVWNINAEIK